MNLRTYHVILVNSSAGKDSQAMLDYVVEMADSQGVSRAKIVVVHCDLGRVEWQGTRELAQEQAAHYGLRFEVVSREKGDLLQQIRERGQFPPVAAFPWCTSYQKRDQVKRLTTRLGREIRAELGVRKARILSCLGLRADESGPRRKRLECYAEQNDGLTVELEDKNRGSNSITRIDTWYPISAWTQEEVWARIHASGVRYHEAYDLGMSRLSCAFCVNAQNSDLRISAAANHDLAVEYLAVEAEIGRPFKRGKTLASIIGDVVARNDGKVGLAVVR